MSRDRFDPNILDTVFQKMTDDLGVLKPDVRDAILESQYVRTAPLSRGFIDELGLSPQEAAYTALRESVWDEDEQRFLEDVEAGVVDDPDRLNELLRELYSGRRQSKPRARRPRQVAAFKSTTDNSDVVLEPSSPVIRERSVTALPPGQTGVKIDDEWWKKKK